MANPGDHYSKRKTKVRIFVIAGLLLVVASAALIHQFAIVPILAQSELSDRQLVFVGNADPDSTSAAFVVGHEHGPEYPAFTRRTVTHAAHVELLLSATKWTIQHGSRDRWSHYFHHYRLTLTTPSGECGVWLSSDYSGWSFVEQPDAWYGGGHLLHLVFGVVYLAAGRDNHFYLTLQSYISTLRHLTPHERSEYEKFLKALAPLIVKIEENPETPLDKFWELSGLSPDEWRVDAASD